MTDEQLIKRMRYETGSKVNYHIQAADRIEQLLKETELLTKEVKLLEIGFDAAQAKLAKAAETLQEIEADFCQTDVALKYAIRTALAELEKNQ